MVYQQFINYPHLSVYENIASPLRVAADLGARADEEARGADGAADCGGVAWEVASRGWSAQRAIPRGGTQRFNAQGRASSLASGSIGAVRLKQAWRLIGAWFPGEVRYGWYVPDRITTHPDICNGRPIVRGTRIAVQSVLEFLAAGDSVDDVLAEYPDLTRADVQACLDYASRLMANHYSIVRAV